MRAVLVAAMLAGVSFLVPVATGMEGPMMIAWKGAGVALLALWCALQAKSVDGWLITAVMAFGALGDVLLETHGLEFGATAFAIGHILAITLYLRNRRATTTGSQKLLALVTPPASIAIVWAMLSAQPGWWHAAIYTLFVAVMAATAWISRFPRYWTGIGAMAFLASDLLIFARMGPLAGAAWAGIAIWALYFGGQALIAIGVTRTLAAEGR